MGPGSAPARIAAEGPGLFLDSDGDLLPDRLEWVLMTHPRNRDSDSDGADDFLEAVQNTPPISSRARPPLDHEMRVLVHTVSDAEGVEHVVVDMLFRFARGGPEQVKRLDLFMMVGQNMPMPIGRAVQRGLRHVNVSRHTTEGTYMITSAVIGTVKQIRALLPCTVGATGVIAKKPFQTGTYLVEAGGEICAIAPVTDTDFTLQALSDDNKRKKFWRGSHMCKLTLLAMGAGWRSFVVEVTEAQCSGAPVLACPPDCTDQSGKIMVVPFGLGFLRGG